MESNKKEVQVHLVPTEDKSHIINDRAIGLQYNSIPLDNTLGYNPQHLYFTSDEDIKEGDWFITIDENQEIIHAVDEQWRALQKYEGLKELSRKIIASTDPKLYQLHDNGVLGQGITRIAQPTQAFIEAYCKQGGIDKVLVEYETNNVNSQEVMFHEEHKEYFFEDRVDGRWCSYIVLKENLKVDPIHNTITTHRIVEKTYTREDIRNAMEYAFMIAKDTADCEYYLKELL